MGSESPEARRITPDLTSLIDRCGAQQCGIRRKFMQLSSSFSKILAMRVFSDKESKYVKD
jgi:hypothetical protein